MQMELRVRVAGTKDQYVTTIVDDEITREVHEYKWRLSTKGYVLATSQKQNVYLHVLVAGGRATHINGDSLDNRKINLSRF